MARHVAFCRWHGGKIRCGFIAASYMSLLHSDLTDTHLPPEKRANIVGLAHFKMHEPAHMCHSLSGAAKCLRQASFMPILVCQSNSASYHFFPSAYFASYWAALTFKPSWMNLSSKVTGDPFLVSQGFYSEYCLVFFSWTKSLVHFHPGTGLEEWIRRCRNIGSKGSSINVVNCKKTQVANYLNSSSIFCGHAM